MTERFLIMTNIEGIICTNYTTEKLLDFEEAVKWLAIVKGADPNAKIVRVVEEVE